MRRSNGEGTIYKRKDGSTFAQKEGKSKRRYVYGKTQKEVKEKLKVLKSGVDKEIKE